MSDLRSPSRDYFQSKWWKRKDVKQVIGLWIVFTGLIGYFSSKFQVIAMGKPASETMENVIHLITVFTWASSPVAGFVAALAIQALSQRRHHGDNPPPEADHNISSSPRATALWLVISALLCLFALVVGLIALQKDDQALLDRNAIHINVTGQQWAWNYDYPGSTGVRSNVLHLPVDQPVVFHVTSKDVKHSFWVVSNKCVKIPIISFPCSVRLILSTSSIKIIGFMHFLSIRI